MLLFLLGGAPVVLRVRVEVRFELCRGSFGSTMLGVLNEASETGPRSLVRDWSSVEGIWKLFKLVRDVGLRMLLSVTSASLLAVLRL
jgi:hypothetical protein